MERWIHLGGGASCNNASFERVYHLDNFRFPEEQAIRKPYRQALALLYANGFPGKILSFGFFHPDREKELLKHNWIIISTVLTPHPWEDFSMQYPLCWEFVRKLL